jgi:hypothetical protein
VTITHLSAYQTNTELLVHILEPLTVHGIIQFHENTKLKKLNRIMCISRPRFHQRFKDISYDTLQATRQKHYLSSSDGNSEIAKGNQSS